ncbi:MAG TPA: hypothetical protein VHL11_12205, partial [Phototrophicaceae bacterium]|nr:hypothetical protein [Phototrophicaceae bacterium]
MSAATGAPDEQFQVTSTPQPTSDSEVDLEHLPLGDGKISTEPQAGYIWSCQTTFNGGGAFRDGDWINGDG